MRVYILIKFIMINDKKFYKNISIYILLTIQCVAILMWTLFIFKFFSNYLKTTQRIIVEI